jgi:uncharacterized SAM-binding protein YcdF (DUF218 family)
LTRSPKKQGGQNRPAVLVAAWARRARDFAHAAKTPRWLAVRNCHRAAGLRYIPCGGQEMPMLGSDVDDDAAGMRRAVRQCPAASSSMLRRAGRSTLMLGAGAALLLGLGFLWFIGRVPADEVALNRAADGIVALTGGPSRIADAIELLASGRGKRLLISGANRATNSNEISRLNPDYEKWVLCCVDFDRALNTLGNAIETRRWAENRGFRSLIVVTSDYHMPRALAEIAHQLPDVALVPFPVVTDRQWWASEAKVRLMLLEYFKYIFAKLRMGLETAAGAGLLR